jgi:hypothetical protein
MSILSIEREFKLRDMQELVSESMASQRFPMVLLGAFTFLALFLDPSEFTV